VDLMPSTGGGAAVLADHWPCPGAGERVLLPSSEIGLPDLADALRAQGYRVDRVPAYAPRPLAAPPAVATDLRAGCYDAVLLTSPSLARAVAELRPAGSVLMVAIGTTTAAGAATAGLRIAATAEQPTPAGVLAALERARTADPPPP
jgi:uroporphyrinogen-III synthase